MNPATFSLAPGDALERIQTLFTELRQTEALEAQVHEMVVAKRQRLDQLLGDFLSRGFTPAAEPAPVTAPAPPPPPAPAPKPAAPEMPLSQHGSYGAPRDLLKNQPAPSAQHVLDSLNRLVAGMKDQSAKSANAA